MTIKEIVLEYIHQTQGVINFDDLTNKVLNEKSDSKWDKTHLDWYKNQIVSPKGKFFHQFSDIERMNLKSTHVVNGKIAGHSRPNKTSTQNLICSYYDDKSKEVEHELANILARVTHHVHPVIVKKIVEENAKYKETFANFCHKSIEIETFFYEGSDCVFPGTRRCINIEKVGKWKNKLNFSDGTILNDNIYPRHIWAFLCAGRAYAGGKDGFYTTSGLNAFELAHVFSHKVEERTLEPKVFKKYDSNIKPYSLFTSASNTVLIPKGLTKPTDKSQTIKIAFYKRHLELYGDYSNLPALSDFDETCVPEWYTKLNWLDPVLPDDWELKVDKLLKYRNQFLKNLYS